MARVTPLLALFLVLLAASIHSSVSRDLQGSRLALDCANPVATHTVVQGDTPKSIVGAVYVSYPNTKWRQLWSLVVACNPDVFPTAPVPAKRLKLPPGTSLAIPAVPAAGITKDTRRKRQAAESDAALAKLCGCTPDIAVTEPGTWQDVAAKSYPGEPMLAQAAALLRMCNRGAAVEPGSERNVLLAGQTLRGICLTIEGQSLSAILGEARTAMTALREEIAASPAASVAEADESATVTAASTTCAITWASTAPVRSVSVSNNCPVYSNACSGPSDGLSFQAELTPCCHAHDWCYSCAWKVGWTGTTGKYNCDYLFWDNLNRACDFNFVSTDGRRSSCKATADAMYLAVSLASQSYFTSEVCPADSVKLANTAFCFNPVVTLDGTVATSSIKPNNGGQWGAWGNYAMCPQGSWASGFAARVESNQWAGDDTALNAIKMVCTNKAGTQTATEVRPHDGYWGTWYGYYRCPVGRHIRGIRMRIESSQGAGDDTAANLLQAQCSDGTILSHPNNNWGSLSNWAYCPTGSFVCGFKVKMEQNGVWDDTAMNDLEAACCVNYD